MPGNFRCWLRPPLSDRATPARSARLIRHHPVQKRYNGHRPAGFREFFARIEGHAKRVRESFVKRGYKTPSLRFAA